MIDTMKKISVIPCVNGSEFLLADFICEYFHQKGFYVERDCGNNILIRRERSAVSPRTILFTPMDSPGYTCLYREENIAYLTATSKALNDVNDIDNVTDFEGNEFPLEKSKYDEKSYSIRTDSVKLGAAFAPHSKLEFSNEFIIGRLSGRFACIAIVMKLAEAVTNSDTAFCFTAGFYSATKAESNVMIRQKAENAILLGFSSDNMVHSILAVKDGKNFSNPEFSKSLLSVSDKKQIMIHSSVFENPVTGAERLFSPFVKQILSLALPCQKALHKDEKVSLSAMNEMFTILSSFLNDSVK